MNVKELKEILSFFPDEYEIYLDLDDLKTLNLQKVEHVFPVHFKAVEQSSILVIDADWGKGGKPECESL